MQHKYRQRSMYDAAFDRDRCAAAIFDGMRMRSRQCQRRRQMDDAEGTGWCRQHHPDRLAEKKKAKQAKYEKDAQRQKARTTLAHARWAIEFLMEFVAENDVSRHAAAYTLLLNKLEELALEQETVARS